MGLSDFDCHLSRSRLAGGGLEALPTPLSFDSPTTRGHGTRSGSEPDDGHERMSKDKRLTHLADDGSARMVDVSDKAITRRVAEASCLVRLSASTATRLRDLPKGDAIA